MNLRRLLSYLMVSASAALLIGVLVIAFMRDPVTRQGQAPSGIITFLFVIALIGALSALGVLVVRRLPTNPIGWLFLVLGLVMSLGITSEQYATATFGGDSLPGISLMGWVYTWTFQSPAFFGLFIFIFLLFPTGRPPSPRWRWVARIGGAATAAIAIFSAFGSQTVPDLPLRNPFAMAPMVAARQSVELVAFPLLLGSLVFSVASVIVRFRRAGGVEKQQLKWLMASGSLLVTSFILAPLVIWPNPALEWMWQIMFLVAVTSIPVAATIAILKYRLYDIDLVINKTLVYAALAAFITLIYVGVVVGIGTLVGQGDEPNLALSLAATGMVAVAFQPVRERVQRVANRLVFGDRLSPYEAVTSFSHKVSATMDPDTLLKEMAEAAARGVGAERSRVRLILPDGSSEEVTWGDHSANGAFDRTLAVTHQAEVVGEISVTKKKGEALTKQDDSLLEDLASQAGLAMRNLRLTEELRHRLVELQESRKRIVAAQDTERRRMERDIHDGAQQQLVSMSVKLSLAQNLLSKDPAKAEGLLDELKAETQEAVESLRDLARGLFPQILTEQGLIPALQSHLTKSQIPATIEDATAGARFDLEVEANIYFVIREALQNASKHAEGAPIAIRLQAEGDHLSFEVRDQGPGFDPATAQASSGTQNMADRIEALGGSFEITSTPGEGTAVRGKVPAEAMDLVS